MFYNPCAPSHNPLPAYIFKCAVVRLVAKLNTALIAVSQFLIAERSDTEWVSTFLSIAIQLTSLISKLFCTVQSTWILQPGWWLSLYSSCVVQVSWLPSHGALAMYV